MGWSRETPYIPGFGVFGRGELEKSAGHLGRALQHRRTQTTFEQERVIVSADTAFGELLARTKALEPSVMLVRLNSPRRAAKIAAILVANLGDVEVDLLHGVIAMVEVRSVSV